jgi:hypothetical protein
LRNFQQLTQSILKIKILRHDLKPIDVKNENAYTTPPDEILTLVCIYLESHHQVIGGEESWVGLGHCYFQALLLSGPVEPVALSRPS